MPNKYDPNALWIALSEYSDGNLFAVYPKLLAELLIQEDAARQEGDNTEAERLVLPSDKEWRLTQYFNLVAMQKTLDVNQQVLPFHPITELQLSSVMNKSNLLRKVVIVYGIILIFTMSIQVFL